MKSKKRLKIAMIGHKRIPSREGGVEIVVEELASRMVKKGHKVVCYNRKGNHVSGKQFNSKKVKKYKGIKLKNVFTINKKGWAAMTSSVAAAIRAAFGRYDVVHFHAEGPCAMLWLPKLFGKRCIATIHGLDWQRSKWGGLASRYIRFGEKMAVKHADEIIVLSENVQEYFKKKYNRKTRFIPNGVERHSVKEASLIKDKYGLVKDGYILYVGRLVPEKGLIYLIEAYKNLNTDKKLVIAGGSSDTEEYAKALKELSDEDDNIIFTGFVQGGFLEELYSNAYIYTLPSDIEGMPLSLLEAMSFGNCCLVSDISECSEVVEDKAVTFKKGKIKDLRKQMQYLCDNPDVVADYKANVADYVCKKYNWDYVVKKTLELYK